MWILAALCGVLIVVFGVFTTRHAPTDAQFGVEVTCLVGGLVLIFLGVVLRRLGRLARRLDEGLGAAQYPPPPEARTDQGA